MKLKKLLSFAVVALFATAMSAQVVVNEMPLGSAQADFFKAYDNVELGFTGQWNKQDSFQYAGLNNTSSAYISVVATKKIKAIRILATGNSQNSAFNPALIGFKEAPEAVITNGSLQVVDFAAAIEGKATGDGKNVYANAVWTTFELDTVDLKAVYIARQWKKIALSEEDTKGAQIGTQGQTIRVYGFQVVLDGQEMPEIPEGPIVVVDPAITKFVIAGVNAKIDNSKKTITAELPYGSDIAAELAKATIEDNQEDLDVVIDAEAMTATLGELVYTLLITVSTEEPVVPQPIGDALFYWQSTGEAPADGDVINALGGTITVHAEKAITTESAAYAEGVPDDMKANGSKGLKFGGNAINFQLRLSEGSFKAGDVLYISGYNPWKVSSTEEQTGDIAAELVTGTSKTDYQVGYAVLAADAEVIYLMRAQGTGTCVAAIKVVRGGEIPQPADPAITSFTVAGVKATIDQEAKTITAVLPYGTDLAAALAAAVVEDNQDTLDVVIDAEAMTATLGELVYTLVITVADKPVQPTGDAIFYWQSTGEAPADGAVLTAQGGTITVYAEKAITTESAAYAEGVADDMKAADGAKGLKFGGNAINFQLRLSEGSFKAGDVLYISGYNPWKVSSTAEQTGDIAAELATGTSKTDYQVGSVTLSADAEVIYLMRALGTGTCVAAIKVVRGGAETGIEANELSSLVYADGIIFNLEHVALTVYSVNGAVITTSNTNINLNLVPAGLYIVSDGKNVMKVIR